VRAERVSIRCPDVEHSSAMRALPLTILCLAAGVVIGCGGDSDAGAGTTTSASGTRCGQPSGVPGEIVIDQPMTCSEAVDVAQAYFESGKAPDQWYSDGPDASKGWVCDGKLPAELRAIAQCGSYSLSAEAQTQLARTFRVRP
jgi:hypothetical protein